TQPGQNIYDGLFHCNLPLFKSTFTPIVAGISSQEKNPVSLYPNPSSGLVHFSNLSADNPYTIHISSIDGKTLIDKNY
ncbi:MAG: hypothetical protein ACPF8V_07260, partial [Luteibaculum sp.]